MKIKTFAKFIAFMLMAMFAVGMLTGCGEDTTNSDTDTTKADSSEVVNNEDNSSQGSLKLKSIEMGAGCSAGITEDGDLYTWGNNAYGLLGNGSEDDSATPTKILDNVKFVSIGLFNGAAITENGDLYAWGCVMYHDIPGEDPYNLKLTTPKKIMENVVSAYIDGGIASAVTEDGSLYVWGDNISLETADKAVPEKVMDNVQSVCHGICSAAALTKDGSVYTWGYNDDGQLGNGETGGIANEPVKIMDNVKAVTASESGNHFGAITNDGDLYMWGKNYFSQVGDGTDENVSSPVKVLSDVVKVSLGEGHSAAITSDGSLYMWGGGYSRIAIENESVPTKVMDGVLDVSLGTRHSAVLKADGLYTWGSGKEGQLGYTLTNEEQYSETPAKVEFFN